MKVKATSTTVDDEAKPRYWLESIAGQTNVEGFDSMVEAFQCYGPQGVAGCGFESRLESMFWTDPNDPAPSSAMCWNAGVKCDGEGPNYTACRAENFDAEGNPGATDEAAVLQPISKYVKFLQTIEDSKQAIDPTQEVLVSMIAGGPDGYENGTAPLVYEDSADAKFQADFGIVADHQLLLPAVGYRQWVLSFSGPLAVRLGYDQALLATVAESLARAVMQDMRWAVKKRHGLTFVEPRLCALVPPPGFHMTRYFGVFANRHHLRPRIIPPSPVPTPGQQLALGHADFANDKPLSHPDAGHAQPPPDQRR